MRGFTKIIAEVKFCNFYTNQYWGANPRPLDQKLEAQLTELIPPGFFIPSISDIYYLLIGSTPYPGLSGPDVMELVHMDYRMKRPAHCPDEW